MRWAGHVARLEKRGVSAGFWCGYLREKEISKDLDVDGRIILKCIFNTWDGEHGLD
jgi:hypothetical protein